MGRLYYITDQFFTEYIYDPEEFVHLVIPSLGAFLHDVLEYYTLMCNYCDQIPCADQRMVETALSMIVSVSRLTRQLSQSDALFRICLESAFGGEVIKTIQHFVVQLLNSELFSVEKKLQCVQHLVRCKSTDYQDPRLLDTFT